MWVAMLLNGGRHPFTNVTIVPQEVVQHVAAGVSIQTDQPDYPEKVGRARSLRQLPHHSISLESDRVWRRAGPVFVSGT